MSIDSLEPFYSSMSTSIESQEKYYQKELETLEEKNMFRNLTCPICLSTTLDMYIDSCQHPICSHCLDHLFKNMKVSHPEYKKKKCIKCPICKFILIKERMKPLRFIRDLIDFNIVKCENQKNGCVYQGRFADYIVKHCKFCIFKDTKCKSMFCKFEGKKHEVLKHEESCKFQIKECKKCSECFILEEYKQHVQQCNQT